VGQQRQNTGRRRWSVYGAGHRSDERSRDVRDELTDICQLRRCQAV